MHDNDWKKKKDGFTVVEIIIYLVIFGVVGTVAASVFNAAIQSKIIVSQNTQVQLDMQRLMERIVDAVHRAQLIQSTTTPGILVLQMSDSSKNPTIIAGSDPDVGFTSQEGTSTPLAIQPSTLSIASYSIGTWTNPSPSATSTSITITGAYNNNGVQVTSTRYTLQTTVMPLQ